jgi:septal ring factor EnvC (AmiA/AmiB activator)
LFSALEVESNRAASAETQLKETEEKLKKVTEELKKWEGSAEGLKAVGARAAGGKQKNQKQKQKQKILTNKLQSYRRSSRVRES